MQILRPCHNKPARKVKNWNETASEALELRDFVQKNNGTFNGHYKKAYAIAHAQVAKHPKDFFVVAKEYEELFGSWCVCNLQILSGSDVFPHEEACMSFPYRKPKVIDRYRKVKVRYWVPKLGILIRKTKTLEDLAALIAQHEHDHAHGNNIYGLK